MKVALAQVNVQIGNFEQNTEKFIRIIHQARDLGADIVMFPELAICGYPARDFLDYKDFVKKCESSVAEIATHCTQIACVMGTPAFNPTIEGKDLYNAAFFLMDGKIHKKIYKTLLPTYDIFDEYRHFESNRHFECIDYKGERIALTICEDLWNSDDDPLYIHSPMDELVKQKPDLMINIAASPFDYRHAETRKKTLSNNCKKYNLSLFYVNYAGAQTELIFDGGSLVIDAKGNVLEELAYFEEDFIIFDSKNQKRLTPESKTFKSQSSSVTSRIYDALVLGIRDYFSKSGFEKAILGLSGGIDSAVVCTLAVRALGKENVLGILMPSQYSSTHSVEDAQNLANNLGIGYEKVPINTIFMQCQELLNPHFNQLPENITEENMQARIRGLLLMAFSNKLNHILLNTSNKSEMAVGYGTLYGDLCGGLSVLGDVYKTQVYELANYINREEEVIPHHTLIKHPSAELRPNQKDQDSLPPYDLLDRILYEYIENKKSINEIIVSGYDIKLVESVVKMVNQNEYKRCQVPPILRVSPKAFGMGRLMPITAKY